MIPVVTAAAVERGITFIHGLWESPCMVQEKTLFLFLKPMYDLNAHVLHGQEVGHTPF